MTNPLRKLAPLCLLAVALPGCGGAEAGSGLSGALAYLPRDAPFVAAFETDLEGEQAKAIEKIVDKFPLGGQLEQGLEQGIESEGVDFEKDVKPLLGNELVLGATDARSYGGDRFVGVIEARDGDKLRQLVERSEGTREQGEKDGARLYENSDGDSFAIDGGMLVLAGSKADLEAALEREESGDGLEESTFEEGTEGLPDDALLRLYADLRRIIAADPSTRDARKVEWISALRTFALSASFAEEAIDVDFRLTTDGELQDSDLPIAAGAETPRVIDRPGEIGLGLRDPAQILRFGEAAAQAVDPGGFADYETAKRTLERRLGISIEDDVLDQVEDGVSVSVSVDGKFGLKAPLKDPAAFEETLDKLGEELPGILEASSGDDVGYSAPKQRGGFYALSDAKGDSIVYRVADGQLLLANDAELAGRLAGERTKSVPGAEGSVVTSADAERLVTQGILGTSGGLQGALGGAVVAGPLGELTGSVRAGTDEITGKLRLTFD